MTPGLVCWKCGASLECLSLPLRRLEACKTCNAELHVCRQCVEFAVNHPAQCREPTVEEVRNKTAANFCDHFKPKPNAYAASADTAGAAARSKAALDELFRK